MSDTYVYSDAKLHQNRYPLSNGLSSGFCRERKTKSKVMKDGDTEKVSMQCSQNLTLKQAIKSDFFIKFPVEIETTTVACLKLEVPFSHLVKTATNSLLKTNPYEQHEDFAIIKPYDLIIMYNLDNHMN
ncbi:hypothetical protein LOAG_04908 [Loa loa]|uniref:Uncharacterized protein n=1 Tax=Loa loa TaxID=7209 RepID=A0A1S0U112_LOALO|nr:hypothetical protein LOAG_04908 [Loa loa]EFO23578.1 hypothetical protein LOAG_04908 [Loa loa]